MKQNIFIAALLAGMLALAGCGGGSSSNNSGGNDDKTPPPPPPPTTTKTAGVPNNLVVRGGTAGLSFNLATGELRFIEGYWFRCTGGTCAGSVAAGAQVGTVSYTGTGTLEILTSNPTLADSSTGNIDQPTESTDPLSNDVLLKALRGTGRVATDNTVWNVGEGAGTRPTNGTTLPFTPLDGSRIDLTISAAGSSNDAYFGHWVKSTADLTSSGDQDTLVNRNLGDRGTVWGGAMPYGKKPDTSLGTASYDEDDAVLLYFSGNGRTWTNATGNLTFNANFETGMVGGNIVVVPGGATGLVAATDNIDLMATMIGNDGKFSGSASFTNSNVRRDSGSWNGGFFGPTTTVTGTPPAEAHAPPDFVAGAFSVSRPAIGTSTTVSATAQNQLHIRGAFGADDG